MKTSPMIFPTSKGKVVVIILKTLIKVKGLKKILASSNGALK
jgi:hypothetical protein